jgi:hypothetical protein
MSALFQAARVIGPYSRPARIEAMTASVTAVRSRSHAAITSRIGCPDEKRQ